MPNIRSIAIPIAAMLLTTATAVAQQAPVGAPASETAASWPEAWFEIFKLAPGKHEEFMRRLARSDEVDKAAGLPPTQVFLHEHGGDWDILLFKPVTAIKPTAAQEAIMEAKRKELELPSGPEYFIHIRETIASHSDTKAVGPVSAEQWVARLDAQRAAGIRPKH